MAVKLEWRKAEKELYLPRLQPSLVTVPPMSFFSIAGAGSPGSDVFQERIGALYAMAYTIRMLPKSGLTPEGFYEYTVYPLEGLWEITVPWDENTPLDKDALAYDLMIRQPSFVTPALVETAREMAMKKKKSPLVGDVRFAAHEDGLSVQMTHIGSYDDEPASFAKMDQFCREKSLRRTGRFHREIYMSDPRKVPVERLRTVLRYSVEPMA